MDVTFNGWTYMGSCELERTRHSSLDTHLKPVQGLARDTTAFCMRKTATISHHFTRNAASITAIALRICQLVLHHVLKGRDTAEVKH